MSDMNRVVTTARRRVRGGFFVVVVALVALIVNYYFVSVRPQALLVDALEQRHAKVVYESGIAWHSDDWSSVEFRYGMDQPRTFFTDFWSVPKVVKWDQATFSRTDIQLLRKVNTVKRLTVAPEMENDELHRLRTAFGDINIDRFYRPGSFPMELYLPEGTSNEL
jgi:hypothetical protein